MDYLSAGLFIRHIPHWGSIVLDLLDEIFLVLWIGRGGPTQWPPLSPAFTPLDFDFFVVI